MPPKLLCKHSTRGRRRDPRDSSNGIYRTTQSAPCASVSKVSNNRGALRATRVWYEPNSYGEDTHSLNKSEPTKRTQRTRTQTLEHVGYTPQTNAKYFLFRPISINHLGLHSPPPPNFTPPAIRLHHIHGPGRSHSKPTPLPSASASFPPQPVTAFTDLPYHPNNGHSANMLKL